MSRFLGRLAARVIGDAPVMRPPPASMYAERAADPVEAFDAGAASTSMAPPHARSRAAMRSIDPADGIRPDARSGEAPAGPEPLAAGRIGRTAPAASVATRHPESGRSPFAPGPDVSPPIAAGSAAPTGPADGRSAAGAAPHAHVQSDEQPMESDDPARDGRRAGREAGRDAPPAASRRAAMAAGDPAPVPWTSVQRARDVSPAQPWTSRAASTPAPLDLRPTASPQAVATAAATGRADEEPARGPGSASPSIAAVAAGRPVSAPMPQGPGTSRDASLVDRPRVGPATQEGPAVRSMAATGAVTWDASRPRPWGGPPRAEPAARAPGRPDTINVTIGRVEVRAVSPTAAAGAPKRPVLAPTPLDQQLRRRTPGGRS